MKRSIVALFVLHGEKIIVYVTFPNKQFEKAFVKDFSIQHKDLSSNMYLHELLCGSEIYVEQLKLPEKSPELIARLKKLKAKQEKVEYDRMVSNINQKWHQTDGMQFGQEVRSGGKQLSSIVNFLLSIIATFTFGYVASQYAFPSIAVRVIIGVLLAFIVAVAELYFMARVEI
ncbi:transmembrane protein 199-like isoform X3 [Stylophora pistillata]|uniref:transmembrane protein 199-like isoform X3 n=1 Tax=Stylophora pistillata TaxID=50429 RepID=UPI000C0517F3|nr:transmembrane protein 199-like isoform X3 [Stylophora pistillata]